MSLAIEIIKQSRLNYFLPLLTDGRAKFGLALGGSLHLEAHGWLRRPLSRIFRVVNHISGDL